MTRLSAILTAMLLGVSVAMSQVAVTAAPDIIPSTQELILLTDMGNPTDSLAERVKRLLEFPPEVNDTMVFIQPLSKTFFLPVVYSHFNDYSSFKPFEREYSENPAFLWLDAANASARNEGLIKQRYMIKYPDQVRYNEATLPEAPRKFVAVVNPKDHTIDIQEVLPVTPDKIEVNVGKKHWLRTFNASLQFSQAYISPNWYQGGNNNLNILANVYYNVQLNKKYHPNLLFESTFQYKLGLTSAPEDSLRNYSISQDLLQINSTFGYKAANHWYYSVTAQFKTQLLNSYVKNTRNLHSAFMSPGDLTAGIGMTYNYANKKKTVTFDASLAPISFGMKTVIKPNDEINHENYNVAADRSCSFKFGSTAEAKLMWQVTKNIQFRSRLYVFSDYDYIQGDWENTLTMDINRYLTTQIYAHLRYDSSTPPCDDPSWHKLQIKEILSFGVSYKFSSL